MSVVFAVDAKSWAEMVKAVTPHLSKDDTRPMLTCVHVVADGAGGYAIEACDSYSLIRASASGKNNDFTPANFQVCGVWAC